MTGSSETLRHSVFKEILEHLEKMPVQVAEQFQEEEGPIQDDLRSVMKTYLSKRRNHDDEADNEARENLAERFNRANFHSPTRPATTTNEENICARSKEALVAELAANPR